MRELEDYEVTWHAMNKSRERGIPTWAVKETLAEGELKEGKKYDNCKIFSKRFENFAHPIGVVVDLEQMRLVTVEHHYMDGNE